MTFILNIQIQSVALDFSPKQIEMSPMIKYSKINLS